MLRLVLPATTKSCIISGYSALFLRPTTPLILTDTELLLDSLTLFLGSGARGGAVGSGTAVKAGRSWFRLPIVSLEFFIDVILTAALWPWGRLSF